MHNFQLHLGDSLTLVQMSLSYILYQPIHSGITKIENMHMKMPNAYINN